MSENPIDLLLDKATINGYEYKLSKDSQNQWQIDFLKNQQNYWQIKQNKQSKEWMVLLLGKPQVLLSTTQLIELLEKHLSR